MTCVNGIRIAHRQRFGLPVLLAGLTVCGLCGSALSAPPLEPLPAPYYSFDLASPKATSGALNADDVLELAWPDPAVAIPGSALGMGLVGDELDGLSSSNDDVALAESFSLLLSVDRSALGEAPPDPTLVTLGVPYNVLDQAERGHAAGDMFMTTALCTLSAGCTLNGRALTPNSVLIRNNYDEGGNDFAADPPTSAEDTVARALQDNVDATSRLATVARDGQPVNVYFSASAESPSLETLSLPEPPSGANIFFNPDPLETKAVTTMFATFLQLGLLVNDDIDALIVFDADADGTFGPGDMILFSLTPSSPSLGTIPGASGSGGGADVFLVLAGGDPELFISAAELGLGMPADNIDALEYARCTDAEACAVARGIRRHDIPALSDWGLLVMVGLIAVTGAVVFVRTRSRAAEAHAN